MVVQACKAEIQIVIIDVLQKLRLMTSTFVLMGGQLHRKLILHKVSHVIHRNMKLLYIRDKNVFKRVKTRQFNRKMTAVSNKEI